jgi:hypothetical protein
MGEQHFQILSDAELEQAAGGVTISLTLDKSGAALSGPLGDFKIPNPFAIIGKTVSGLFGLTGDVLKTVGGALTSLGQLFDFG